MYTERRELGPTPMIASPNIALPMHVDSAWWSPYRDDGLDPLIAIFQLQLTDSAVAVVSAQHLQPRTNVLPVVHPPTDDISNLGTMYSGTTTAIIMRLRRGGLLRYVPHKMQHCDLTRTAAMLTKTESRSDATLAHLSMTEGVGQTYCLLSRASRLLRLWDWPFEVLLWVSIDTNCSDTGKSNTTVSCVTWIRNM